MSAANAGLVPSKTTLTGTVVGVVTPDSSRLARLRRMRRSILNSTRRLIHQRRGFRDKWKLVTTTYAPGASWSASDIRDFLRRVSLWMKRRRWEFAYVWTMELTKAGIPHYHVLIRIPYRGQMPKADVVGWWPHGLTNTVTARNAVGYIAKYASKGTGATDFPKGARIHGAGGLTRESRMHVQFWNLPVWARNQMHEPQPTSRIKGGIVNRATGEFLPTPYRVLILAGSILIVRID